MKLLHLKRLHLYEARLTAYEAFCGVAAKYEAPHMRYEAKPFQASFTIFARQKWWASSYPNLRSLSATTGHEWLMNYQSRTA